VTTARSTRKRVLIVNCYLDETRRDVARSGKVPQTVGPIFLAGWFHPDRWDIRLHNEHSHGPLEDKELLGWPDLVVLTGLTTSVDRLRQITAYVRTLNPRVVVVGGGHVARAFPSYCATFLDVVCQGDVEEIAAVIAGLYGPEYATDEMLFRYDLAPWIGRVGYVESTRYCNFKCDFCILTAEGRRYQPHGLDFFRRQLNALGKKRILAFLDNNFYGSDRKSYEARLEVVREAWQAGQFKYWVALVTGDYFLDDRNISRAKETGLRGLFSGVESLDPEWIAAHNKRQNGGRAPTDLIRNCLESGVIFTYGLILDIYTRPIADLRRELEFVLGCDEITLPAFLSLPIPYPGTPHFYRALDAGTLLPGTRIRDLDSTTITSRPLDAMADAIGFVRDLQSMRGYRTAVLRHGLRFARRYRRHLPAEQMGICLANGPLLCAPLLATLPGRIGSATGPRTYLSTTEPLDRAYRPAFRVDPRYESLFQPTFLTDASGALSEAIAEDVQHGRSGRRTLPPAPVALQGAARH
jgi:hypothetical protein